MNESSVAFNSSLTGSEYILSVIVSINLVFCLPANAYVLWLSVHMGLQNEIFFFNLALNETLYCLGSVLYLWAFYARMLDLIYLTAFFKGFLISGRPLFQCCICMERYVAVVHPITFMKCKQLRNKLVGSAVIWTVNFSFALVLGFFTESFLPYKVLLAQYALIFPIKLFSCLMVLRALKQPGPSENRKGIQRSKVKAFWIILMALISSVLTYIPMFSSLVLAGVLDKQKFNLAWLSSVGIVVAAGCIQPLIYMQKYASLSSCRSC